MQVFNRCHLPPFLGDIRIFRKLFVSLYQKLHCKVLCGILLLRFGVSPPPLPVQAQQTGRVKTHFDIFMIPTPSLSKEAKNE
ncbi:MAG: hypothetical protein COY50_10800 [Deltaproteobacteria bacterium CG_4_10_14_0_8_um_filter_43_12]|nr:MAG: hypothetical protein COY50_10800 [Deltaproteobacteria bacterium CG_4_10_14_0_8_um_filter_43_12]